MITPELIRALSPRHPNPQAAATALQQAAVKFGITDPRSVAAWLANLMTESNLVPVRENMYYTDADRARGIFRALKGRSNSEFLRNPQGMANIVYAGKLGNGNVASGDGWRYRGGGFIQTTGRSGYRNTGKLIGLDLEGHPELLEQYGPAALAAAAYWTRLSSAHQLACRGDIRGTRRAVNGPKMLHCDLMLSHYARVLPRVQDAYEPRVLLVPLGGGEPAPWDGEPARYSGHLLDDALVATLRLAYPQPGGPFNYSPGLRVFVRQSGDLVLERAVNIPS
ncbi:hypothetical protein D3875_02610 [Deinococcus cavernae]|uniref:Glycoside hydrolase family 19 protein n=1 Tax=Deinococcus cavernae TaxID=2320857 RepID=A0A418VFK1_9DEIO|nr:hypothetical protein [Deinococcus cavernae]RJF74905.1 hypothetical protein D3875_02610 [Deinococcus cavernae]